MKKKVIGLFGIMAVSTGVFFATSAAGNISDISLTSLIGVSDANAECQSTPINNGRCSFTGNCFPNPGGPVDCDSTKG